MFLSQTMQRMVKAYMANRKIGMSPALAWHQAKYEEWSIWFNK